MRHIYFSVRTLIFIRDQGRVLLIKKEHPENPGTEKWNGIGGHVESEEDIFTAANREIYEETHLEVKNLWLSAVITLKENKATDVILFVFNANRPLGSLQSSEEGQVEWFEEKQIENIPIFDDLKYLLQETGNVRKGYSPKIMHYRFINDKRRINLIRTSLSEEH